ncbi:MAG: hypothetical protein CL756_04480 [Chloroflexi bacterium]|nr:hypothetical protein [Chloroflexota bacterium]MBB38001.1 hypothetical protein [Actinomycetota bacterium]
MTLDLSGGVNQMIIVDYNQISISNLMAELNGSKDSDINIDLVRHMILNTLRSYKTRWGDEYGDLVIACDNRRYWRRTVFPQYKASRKKTREDSGYDWTSIFEGLSLVRNELQQHMPYPVVDVDGAEADDVIGTLVEWSQKNDLVQEGLFESPRPLLIISGDHDFQQLQKYENVVQYSPLRKRFVKIKESADAVLREHIIRGDKGDGVPNILSDDDSFVEGKRQRPIRKALVAEWKSQKPEEWVTGEMAAGYIRNKTMVDLSQTPEEIKEQIVFQYTAQLDKSAEDMYKYFMNFGLDRLIEVIDEF